MNTCDRRIRHAALAAAAAITAISVITAPPQAALAQEAGALEDIVVTARKREESLQDTPMSVTAFTGESLARQQIDSLDGIAPMTPNLMFDAGTSFSGSSSASAVFIRGIGQLDFTLTSEPGVGIFVDGVYVSQSIGSVLDLVDVERIEVLRGPQGTLFGRNTIGGAISVTSRRPNENLEAKLEITGGEYDRLDLDASVNLPLTDTLYARLSAATYNRDGFVATPNNATDSQGDIDRIAGRAALRFVPGDRVDVNLSFDYSRARESGTPTVLVGTFEGASLALIGSLANPASPDYLPPPAPLPAPSFMDLHNLLATTPIGQQGGIAGVTPGVVPSPLFGQPVFSSADTIDLENDPLVNNSLGRTYADTDTWGLALDIQLDLGAADLRSITSYRDVESDIGWVDGLPTEIGVGVTYDEYEVDQFSQEFQLSGAGLDDRLQWLLGFYYFEEDGLNLDDVEFTSARFLSGAQIDNRSIAGFGQLSFNITDRLAVTGGLRYTDEQRRYNVPDDCFALPNGPATLFDGSTVGCSRLQTVVDPKFLNAGFLTFANAPVFPDPGGRFCCLPIADANGNVLGLVPGLTPGFELVPGGTTELNFSEWTPHASIDYQWTDTLMTYVSYSEGFKSGGFVQRVFPPRNGVPTYAPETAEVYELGLKWTGLERRLRVNAAVFHTDYEDLQVQVNDGIAPVTRNAAEAEIRGAELEASAALGAGWLIMAGVGYLDAEYTALDPQQNFATDLRRLTLDSELVNAPEWSTHLGLQYTLAMPFGGELITRGDWSYTDDVAKDALNYPELLQPGYHLFNASLTWLSETGTWEVSAFGTNLSDERYIVSGFANALTQSRITANPGRPREWGVSLAWHFGE